MDNHAAKKRDRLITIPVDLFEIEDALPKTDCKICGHNGCFEFTAEIEKDHSAVSKCPYMKSKLYWLQPKSDCLECGYDTCADFIKAVNADDEMISKCQYVKENDAMIDYINEQASKKNTRPIPDNDQYMETLDLRETIKKVGILRSEADRYNKQKPENILKVTIDENLSTREKETFFKKELQKANDLIEDEMISQDLEHMRQNITDIYAMFTKHPMLHDQVHKFSSTYLPMTLELLDEYLMLESKVLHEEATDKQQQKIAEAIGKAKAAFIKLNDDLFRQISYDIDAQIKAFDDILTIDGLLSNDDFKIDQDDDKKEDR